MIDIAWSEFLFIALLALILIGPKELPSVLQNIGRWIGKVRAFTKDFSAQLDLHAHLDDPIDPVIQDRPSLQNNEPPHEKQPKPFQKTKP